MVLLSSGGAASQSVTGARIRSVTIENMQFSPAALSVHRGDRIVWANKDLFPHTVTASNKAFDSGSIAAGGSWTYVANKAGEFSYGCTFHPTMKGSLKVQ
jgi:plastocyanin